MLIYFHIYLKANSFFQMKEIFTIHIGKAGLQVGSNVWELFCQEHGVDVDGSTKAENHQGTTDAVFSRNSQNRCTARCLFLDIEGDTIDEISTGTHRQLFSPQNYISAYQGPTTTYAKGRRYKQIVELSMERIRKVIDKSDQIQGLLIFNSIGGGTGSGVASLLSESLSATYPKLNKFHHTIMDSHSQSSQPEIYNSIFSINDILEHSAFREDLSIMFDNSAIRNICSRNLLVPTPSLPNINSVISQWVSSFTAPFRFGSYSERTMQGLYSRLVPYHSFKFMLPSYSPFFSSEMPFYGHESLHDITVNCFEPANMMVKCDPRNGKYMGAYFGFRGDIPTKDINLIICGQRSRKIVQFVDWTSTGSTLEFTKQYPVQLPGDCLASAKQSCCFLSNNTAFREVFNRMLHKFDSIFQSKKGVNRYIEEGMEEDNFIEARERLSSLSADYAQAEKQTQQQPAQ